MLRNFLVTTRECTFTYKCSDDSSPQLLNYYDKICFLIGIYTKMCTANIVLLSSVNYSPVLYMKLK